jgi:3-hydroxyisobutyrate dehydrogenase-like beta-hydroxyacid dehydrogenase
MSNQNVGILHPGEMGISVAASIKNSDREVFWVSEGRSEKTLARAAKYELTDASCLQSLCDQCDIIFSVCPPHAAEDVAAQVIECSFSGMYVDANAISPQRSISIGKTLVDTGIIFVDGGIVGGPAWQPGTTWLHLAGQEAETAADCFAKGHMGTRIIGPDIGKASALKMCFAAYTKGTTALLSGIISTAEALGVRQELFKQWEVFGPDFADQSAKRVQGVTAKAWRFVGEMEEISKTFEEAGLPGGFHAAAADIYRRIGHFKDSPELPSLEAVLSALTKAD